ncbi:MAG: tRNA 2-selenouridine(34) synthase MnmH [Nanoarchaeota archaeon]|nr:tRNA 2-selenouridine(34) synthase MnmH [Nanoarchaeota archaeon]MBU1622329.1 tRNA 2-selenouridine(34) synthase MnmH [Nanoarchaeota archaeon]MBU1974114.1 tRNA 2-selenouridine(34) synthase MnmH [Nanoarchaeota archaeon]
MVQKISIEEALKLKNTLLVDARSPHEYSHDHILDAINLPLLNDKEHHMVGTIYIRISKEDAIEKGMEYYAEKVPTIIKTIQPYKDKTIIVYCARGGMRSKIIASLLDSIGLKVYQIDGGYKLFRHYLLEQLNNFKLKPKVYVLHGLTCTGKTSLLENLPNSLDLEQLAQHRGSLYGAVGRQPHSQKKFENLLLKRLTELNNQPYIFVEGESRKIGDLQIPSFLWQAMEKADNLLITRTLPVRVKAMAKEYFIDHPEEIKEITASLWKVISKKNKTEMLELLEKKEYEQAAEILLTKYYDPLYDYTLKKEAYLFEVNNNHLEEAVKIIKNKVTTD